MVSVTVREAKIHLSQLLERVEHGEEIVIVRAGKPVARLVKAEPLLPRRFGTAKGTIKFHDGWNDPMTEEELTEFIGE